MMTLVHVSLERDQADIIDSFKEAIRMAPEIMAAFFVMGEVDFVLLVTVRDTEDFEQFTRRFLYGKPYVSRFASTVVINRVKAGFVLPISASHPARS
jgi:Lrp/AsnC family leucine-responsive transcriptional regulator